MNWNELTSASQLEELKELSKNHPVLIFKHSTRCAISAMSLNRLERKWRENTIYPYFLDLIRYREVSNEVSNVFGVMHESPQAILIKNGEAVFNTSHSSIDFEELVSVAKGLEAA